MLLGGLRVRAADQALLFLPPQLVTLCLAALAMALFLRAGLVRAGAWVSADLPLLVSAQHALTLLALFAATAQAINSVLPEQGLLHWVFALCFFWTLWQDQFQPWAVARLLKSLAVLFATAFLLKHVLLGALYGGPNPALSRRILNALLEGVTLGSLDAQAFAPATGYVSFLTIALYIGALAMVRPVPDGAAHVGSPPRGVPRAAAGRAEEAAGGARGSGRRRQRRVSRTSGSAPSSLASASRASTRTTSPGFTARSA